MRHLLAVVTLLLVTCSLCAGKTFTRCGLVTELRKYRFPEREMRDWVCLVENESSRMTDVIGKPNTDGSRDHGLFQINDRYWCSDSSTPGKECRVACAELRTDNIASACTCARKIYQVHGFSAWYGWRDRCKGKPLPDISMC